MLEKIGVRQFRNNLATYIDSANPVAVVRHGQIVGYFLPAQPRPTEEDLDRLKRAAKNMELLLQEHGLTEDELVSEFRQLREQGR